MSRRQTTPSPPPFSRSTPPIPPTPRLDPTDAMAPRDGDNLPHQQPPRLPMPPVPALPSITYSYRRTPPPTSPARHTCPIHGRTKYHTVQRQNGAITLGPSAYCQSNGTNCFNGARELWPILTRQNLPSPPRTPSPPPHTNSDDDYDDDDDYDPPTAAQWHAAEAAAAAAAATQAHRGRGPGPAVRPHRSLWTGRWQAYPRRRDGWETRPVVERKSAWLDETWAEAQAAGLMPPPPRPLRSAAYTHGHGRPDPGLRIDGYRALVAWERKCGRVLVKKPVRLPVVVEETEEEVRREEVEREEKEREEELWGGGEVGGREG